MKLYIGTHVAVVLNSAEPVVALGSVFRIDDERSFTVKLYGTHDSRVPEGDWVFSCDNNTTRLFVQRKVEDVGRTWFGVDTAWQLSRIHSLKVPVKRR